VPFAVRLQQHQNQIGTPPLTTNKKTTFCICSFDIYLSMEKLAGAAAGRPASMKDPNDLEDNQ
jgi:hypothetical protein